MRPVALALTAIAVLAVSCGDDSTDAPAPAPTNTPLPAPPPPALFAPPPYNPGVLILEREIIRSDLIVRATMSTVEASVISDAQGKYRPNVKFKLTVHETLKGQQYNIVHGFWIGPYSNDTRDEAVAKSRERVAGRDTQWDDREALIFLHRKQYPDLHENTLDTSSHYIIAKEFETGGPADDAHSLHSVFRRTWLPAAGAGGQGAASVYLLEPPGTPSVWAGPHSGHAPPHPNGSTITLKKIKQLIREVTAEYAGAARADAYTECLDQKYQYLHRVRNKPLTSGSPHTFWKAEQTMASGQPADTTIDSNLVGMRDTSTHQVGDVLTPADTVSSFVGRDAELFSFAFTPFRAYSSGNTGLQADQLLRNTRPLPAGTYHFNMESRPAGYAICNFFLTEDYTVTVTAPEHTLHEALFDPVTDGSAVGVDSSNGVLNPSAFTDANGAAATVQRIEWASDTVKMKVSPHTGLAGHKLDFIELDGTVSLSLDVDDATVDAANGTLSWAVTPQPWHDGDKLMLRIAEIPPKTAVTEVPSTIAHGSIESLTVKASGLTSSNSYSIELSTNNSAIGFGDTCSTIPTKVTLPSSNTPHSMTIALQGCLVATSSR